MAVSPVIPSTVQVRLLWSLGTEGAVNVLNFIATGAVTVNQALANTVGSAVKTAFTNQLAVHIATTRTLAKVGVRDMRVANGVEFLDSGAAAPGTGAGDPLPNATSLMLTLRTAGAGKSFRGRIYLPGFIEADNTATGVALAAASTAAVNFIGQVQGSLGSSGLTLGVATRNAERQTIVRTTFHNDGTTTVKTLSNIAAKSAVTNAVTLVQARSDAWETQRRRVNGRGAAPALAQAVAEVQF